MSSYWTPDKELPGKLIRLDSIDSGTQTDPAICKPPVNGHSDNMTEDSGPAPPPKVVADLMCKSRSFPNREHDLYCRYWTPILEGSNPPREAEVKALVFLSHGYGEHLKWYSELAEKLCEKGYMVFGHDHYGHGKSGGTRGEVEDIGILAEDVLTHVAQIKVLHDYRGLPCYIYAHSMGGMVALKCALRNPGIFRGLILEGPFVIGDFWMNLLIQYKWTMYWAKMAASVPYVSGLPIKKIPAEEVTSDKEYQTQFEEDQLNHHGAINLRMALSFAKQLKRFSAPRLFSQLELPMLIMQATDDSLCLKQGAEMLANSAESEDVNLILFDNAQHHLLLEREDVRIQVMNETLSWLESHYPQAHAKDGPKIKMEPQLMEAEEHERMCKELLAEERQRRKREKHQQMQEEERKEKYRRSWFGGIFSS